ncbi:MAG: tetratricopeptide repeat protein [Spirochaetes bacterium]|nr:tetratricopeptide repeat protein [Spirochaetota bacterium]
MNDIINTKNIYKDINRKINFILKKGFNNIELKYLLEESNNIYNLSYNSNYFKGIAYSFYFKGVYHNYISEFEKAKQFLIQAYNIFEKLNDILSLSRVCLSLGYNFTERNYYLKGLIFYQKILYYLKRYKSLISKDIYIKTLNNIGVIYLKNNLFSKAREYFLQALKIADENNLTNFKVVHYENIGITYVKEKKYDMALFYFNKSIETLNSINIEINKIRGLSYIYYELGNLYKDKKEYDTAYIYFLNSIFYSYKINNNLQILLSNIEILEIFLFYKKFRNFKKHLIFILKLARQIKAVEPMANIYKILSKYFFIRNEFKKALFYKKKYIKYYNNLFKKMVFNKLTSQELELLDLQKEKEMEIIEIKRKKLKEKNIEIKKILSEIEVEINFSKKLFEKIFKSQNLNNGKYTIISNNSNYNKNSNKIYLTQCIYFEGNTYFIMLKIKNFELSGYFISLLIYTIFLKLIKLYGECHNIYIFFVNLLKKILDDKQIKFIKILIGNLIYDGYLKVYSNKNFISIKCIKKDNSNLEVLLENKKRKIITDFQNEQFIIFSFEESKQKLFLNTVNSLNTNFEINNLHDFSNFLLIKKSTII